MRGYTQTMTDDECAEGGQHHTRRHEDEHGWHELCTECGELLDTSDDSHL